MKTCREIYATRILEVLEHDAETGELRWRKRPECPAWSGRFAGTKAGTLHVTKDGKRYVAVVVDRRRLLVHRVIWTLVNGPIGPGLQIDHIDGDGTNNRLSNLRLVDQAQNAKNMRLPVNNATGYIGVRRSAAKSERYQAFATIDGRFYNIGTGATPKEAHTLRVAFDRKHGFHENHGQERPL